MTGTQSERRAKSFLEPHADREELRRTDNLQCSPSVVKRVLQIISGSL
jgi:hypothetical protein